MSKGIKYEDVKNLPPIEELCKPVPRSTTIEVHSLQRFDNRDIPYSKPLDQCLDEFDNFIVKQDNFNKRVQNHLLGLVWLPSFGARIKEFIYNSINYLFGYHGIGYGIHFEFHGFSPHA
jgi:hypothetical protein